MSLDLDDTTAEVLALADVAKRVSDMQAAPAMRAALAQIAAGAFCSGREACEIAAAALEPGAADRWLEEYLDASEMGVLLELALSTGLEECERLRALAARKHAKLAAVLRILEAAGCECECSYRCECCGRSWRCEHEEPCERCLACRVEAAIVRREAGGEP